ncbi:MAG: TRAP transporter large permease [Synergistetes bacterium]|nr:TRAP transporter large permease [Synergistota bacterium]MCX8127407.1 TRAP transporter large permease [Synergistota bacterium]MDW8192271.1 TRAP transporter large permease [Synergistota bacterium]
MTPLFLGAIGTFTLILLFLLKIPVAIAMALVGFIGFGLLVSFPAAMKLLAVDFFSSFNSYTLGVIPLFVLMGQLAHNSGMSKRLYEASNKLIGHLPGGLAIATIWASAGFAAICGSTNASTATMAMVALPEMKRYGYSESLAAGCVAAGGSLGIMIPPSVIFVIYGILTQQSIGKLFIAGILPGIMLSILFSIAIYVWAKIDPQIASKSPKSSWKERLFSLLSASEVLLIFLLVVGGLLKGIFTPIEAGAVGTGLIGIISLLRKRISWEGIKRSLQESVRISCMIIFVVAGAAVFGHFLAITRLPQALQSWLLQFENYPYLAMAFIILIYVISGCFIDALALILLTIPIFYPVVIKLGFDPIWFGVMVVLVTQIGVITPPVGINAYVIKGIFPEIPMETIFKGVTPFFIALILGAILLMLFPQITLI